MFPPRLLDRPIMQTTISVYKKIERLKNGCASLYPSSNLKNILHTLYIVNLLREQTTTNDTISMNQKKFRRLFFKGKAINWTCTEFTLNYTFTWKWLEHTLGEKGVNFQGLWIFGVYIFWNFGLKSQQRTGTNGSNVRNVHINTATAAAAADVASLFWGCEKPRILYMWWGHRVGTLLEEL